MSEMNFYRCEKCKNIVALIQSGGGTLTCCGEAMTKLEANVSDGAKEKHVPVVSREGDVIKVSVGSTLHPMLQEHFIQWIALVSDGKAEFRYLKPGEKPVAEFSAVDSGTVYEYCNIHGLWKSDF